MTETERKEMEEINKQLNDANAAYLVTSGNIEDLKKTLDAISLRIFRLKKRVNNFLDGE